MEKKTVPLARFAHRVLKMLPFFAYFSKYDRLLCHVFRTFFSGFLCKLESVLIAAVPNFEERERKEGKSIFRQR